MRLVILGSSGTFPAPGRPGSGYLVEREGTTIWIDAGPGTFMALADRTEPSGVDAVVISHVHPDHCTDLFAFYHYTAYGPGGAAYGHSGRPPVPVYAPAGVAERVAAFVGADDPSHPVHAALDFRKVGEGDTAEVGPLHLQFAATDHSVPTVGVRIDAGGPALVYSADTGPGGGVPVLAAGARLLLCEASYQGDRADYEYPHHLTAAEAGALARAAGVDRLMLTHIPPVVDPRRSVEEAEAEFGRAVELAVPGMEVRL